MKADEIEVGGYYEWKDGTIRVVTRIGYDFGYGRICAWWVRVKGHRGDGIRVLHSFAKHCRRRLTPAEVEQVERGRAGT